MWLIALTEEAFLEVVSEWKQCFKNCNAHLWGKQEKLHGHGSVGANKIVSAEWMGSWKAKGTAKAGGEWIRAPLNENLVIVNLLYPPFLHSSQVTHLHSENTACVTNTILMKHLIQIPPNSEKK